MNSTPEQSPLGKVSQYIDQYAPSLLFPIARLGKREEIGVPSTLPFYGVDVWNAFEISWLNAQGKPEVALARISIPADTPNIIESKSFKLYLNSFNNTRMTSGQVVEQRIAQDISAAAGGDVSVTLFGPSALSEVVLENFSGIYLDTLDVTCEVYQPDPSLLITNQNQVEQEIVCSDLLKSNCLVTGQPDWGSVQITYSGAQIDHEQLLKYIVSFRNHNEFHEQCVERIFMDISRQCQPSALTVEARYTRRGGLDINPFRTTEKTNQPKPGRLLRQ